MRKALRVALEANRGWTWQAATTVAMALLAVAVCAAADVACTAMKWHAFDL